MTSRDPYDPLGALPDGLRAVEASAGTGKTYSISTTVLRLVLEEAVGLDAMLVVTFTRAATAELAERVRRRLAEAAAVLEGAATDDEVLRELLDRATVQLGQDRALALVEGALQQVDEARITTIHGFCNRVLQQAAIAADTEPDVELDEERDQQLLLRRVVDDWIVRHVRDASLVYVDALHEVRLGRDGLHAVARAVADESLPFVVPAHTSGADPRQVFADAHATFRAAVDATLPDVARWSADSHAARQVHGGARLAPRKIDATLAPLVSAITEGRCPPLRTLEELSTAGVTSKLKAGGEPPRLSVAVDDLLVALTTVERLVRTELGAHVATTVPAARSAAARLGFSDILRLLHDALDDESTAERLRSEIGAGVDVVLVDEFQDTDPVQWSVLRRLFRDTVLFEVVGDPKQAIYGWRGADLETYLRALAEAELEGGVVTMRCNWRSDGAYIAACNGVLGQPGAFGDDRISYVPVGVPDRHAGALLTAGPGAAVSGLELVLHERAEGTRKFTTGVFAGTVAGHVAEEIVDVLRAGWVRRAEVGAPALPVGPQDCAVLVRTNAQAEQVADEIRRRGVAAVLGGGRDVLGSVEAAAVDDLLAALLEPGLQRPLRRVLVGPFCGLDATELAGLDEAGWERWARVVRGWTETWQRRGVAALLDRAVRDGDAELRAAGFRDGDRVMTNLRHLAELLDRAEQDESLGGHALLAWLRARRAEGESGFGRTSEARELRLERDDDAVRVLTVHAAKGLEFPLVWAPFLWAAAVRAERADTRTRPFVVNDPAAGHRRTVVLHPAATDAAAGDAERRRLRRLADEEEWRADLRLAYVALTRAQHRCVLHVGGVDGLTASPAWHLLFGRDFGIHDVADGPAAPSQSDDELFASLTRHAAQEGVTARRVTGRASETSVVDVGRRAPEVAALRWSRAEALDVGWARSSFTQLLDRRTAPARDEAIPAEEVDRDEQVVEQATDVDVEDAARGLGDLVPLATMPRGADWGVFLHGVYEHVPSFASDLAVVRETVVRRAREEGMDVGGALLDAISVGVHASLHTPLGPDIGELRLADVPNGDRLDELRFTLAIASPDRLVDVTGLADVLGAAASRHPGVPLEAAADHLRAGGTGDGVHGLLVGAIDLVLRERTAGRDRWWIADYKSNGLGSWDWQGGNRVWAERVGHHRPDRVLDAMVHGDYLLQAHLYVVALHRYLQTRLGAAYDYDEHVGGWAYLFVRGMTGTDVARDGARPHGIATGRPDRQLVEDLDALLSPDDGRRA